MQTWVRMFAGDSFTDKKLSDSIDTSDSLLRQLKPNETAMSVTVRSLANGLSGKLQQGDIIQIVSVDEDDKAQIYEELQYVEVLATTSDKGSDDTYRDGEVNADDEDSGDQSLYATVTIILQDRAQALRLAECENTSLHAVFVTRGDEKLKAECLKAQDEAAMKNALGRISGTIPYCPKAAEYLNQGTLLTKAVDDRTYNTTIKSLAELVTKEV